MPEGPVTDSVSSSGEVVDSFNRDTNADDLWYAELGDFMLSDSSVLELSDRNIMD